MLIVKLTNHFPLRVMDWFVSGIVATLGFVVLGTPPNDWSNPIYSTLSEFAPSDTWGLILVILGLVRLLALFINGSMRKTPHARMLGAFLTAFVWLQLSFAMYSADATAIAALAIYPWLFLADIYNVYRAAQDARISDHLYHAAGITGARIHRDANSA